MTIEELARVAKLHLAKLHRYTITSEGASKGYFRLVEDPQGAWLQWPELSSLIEEVAAVLDRPAPPPAGSAWKLHLVGDRQQLAGAIRASTGSLNFRADHSAIDIFADAVVTAYQRQPESRPAPPPEETNGKQ